MTEIVNLSFYPQLNEIIGLPVFKGSKIIGGLQGTENLIKGINLSDTPEYCRWLSQDEMMVTTCYSIYKDAHAVAHFIETLAQKGISAVCIKPAPYLGEIPKLMIDQADKWKLPLIELPAEVQFSEITKAISDELIQRQTVLLTSTIRVNEMLTRTIIEGAGLPEIAKMIAELAGTSVLILDTLNHRRAFQIHENHQQELGCFAQNESIDIVITKSRVHKLKVGNYSFGFLYLYKFDTSTYLPSDTLLQIMQTISLEISREHSIRERSDNGFSAYLMHLLSDTILDEVAEQVRATEYGLDLEENHMILHISVTEQSKKSSHYALEFQRTLLTSNLISLMTNLALSPKIIPSTEGYLLLLSAPNKNNDLANLSARFPEFLMMLSRKCPTMRLAGGCGRAYPGLRGLVQSGQEANIALKVATSESYGLMRFADLGVIRLIYATDPEREIEYFVSEKLKDLINPRSRNSELLQTLEFYFHHFGNVKRISEEMYTHYNTVAYRLKNIQEITKTDFQNPNDRFELELALRLYLFKRKESFMGSN